MQKMERIVGIILIVGGVIAGIFTTVLVLTGKIGH
jgi:hypothetical protein